jgi:Ni/Co efflux regulator RcnB
MKVPLTLLVAASLAAPLAAEAKNDKHERGHDRDDRGDLTVVITGDGRGDAPRGKPLPPGLQKKLARGGDLPPGWQKKLARGEVVPADIWALRQPLPSDVLRRFPQRDGVLVVRVDNQVLAVAAATMILLDVFDL